MVMSGLLSWMMMMFAAKTCAINTTPLWHNAHKRLNYLVVNSCQQSQVVVELLSRANWQQFLDGICDLTVTGWMGDSWSHRCGYTGSPKNDLGATDPRSPVSVDPWDIWGYWLFKVGCPITLHEKAVFTLTHVLGKTFLVIWVSFVSPYVCMCNMLNRFQLDECAYNWISFSTKWSAHLGNAAMMT